MSMFARLVVLIPLLLSVAAFILSVLCLTAGHKEGFMEDFAVARLNVSGFGQDLIDTGSDDANTNQDEDGGFLDDIGDAFNDVKDSVLDEVNDLVGDMTNEVADKLGLADWYSLHIMDRCEGDWKPSHDADNAKLNVTYCSDPEPGYNLNLTEVLDKQLSLGPIDISLNELGWEEGIQDKIDILNDMLLGLFILYVLSICFTGLAFLACAVGLVMPDRRFVCLLNLGLSILGGLTLLIASILLTVANTVGINKVNEFADELGIKAAGGTKFLILSWVAAAVMLSCMVFWISRYCTVKRARKNYRGKEAY